jgi:hypothetical protein
MSTKIERAKAAQKLFMLRTGGFMTHNKCILNEQAFGKSGPPDIPPCLCRTPTSCGAIFFPLLSVPGTLLARTIKKCACD